MTFTILWKLNVPSIANLYIIENISQLYEKDFKKQNNETKIHIPF